MLKKFSMIVSVVALLTLALVGCKNGMLGEDEATVNGIRDMSEGRTAYVTITNFAGTGATRSAAGGSLRTIAPAQPDITNADFLFIVEGESKGSKYGPEKVIVTNGRMNLEGLSPALWKITVTAFSKDKIRLNGGQPDNDDANVIMTTYKDNSAIMAGTGTVDLIRVDADVKITLTTRGMGTQGDIDLEFELEANDKREVQTNNYNVTIGLYEKLTGTLVDTQKLAAPSENFDSIQAQAAMAYRKNNVPIGEYVVKVTINPDGTGNRGPWTWSDNIYVEGNLTTTNKNPGAQVLPRLIGQSPKEPSNFIIHWNSDPSYYSATDGNYVARFAWDRGSYNEDYFELQVMDVTDKINETFTQYNLQAIRSNAELWTQIDQNNPGEIITVGKQFAQLNYPIYKTGSLLAANTYAEYTLQTGRLYAFRFRATNSNGSSPWVYSGVQEPTNGEYTTWKGLPISRTARSFEKIAAAVFTVTYDLTDYILLKDREQVIQGIKTESIASSYDPDTPYNFKYTAWSQADNPQGYQLYKANAVGPASGTSPERINWDSWVDKLTNNVYARTVNYERKFANLVLRPNAVSGNSVQLETLNSGTYSGLLTPETLLVHFANTPAAHNFTVPQNTDSIQEQVNQGGDKTANGRGAGFGRINNNYGINVDKTQVGGNGNYVTFSVGGEINAQIIEGKLQDQNQRTWNVLRATYSIRQNGYTVKDVTGYPKAVMDLAGLGGDYTLYVEAHSDTGYNFTYQVPIVIKDITENAAP